MLIEKKKKKSFVAKSQHFISRGPNTVIRGYQAYAWLVPCAFISMLSMQLRTCSPGLHQDPQMRVHDLALGGETPKSQAWVKCYQHWVKPGAQAWTWNCFRVKGWRLGLKLRFWARSRTETAFIPVPWCHLSALKNKVGMRRKLFCFLCFSVRK